MKILQATLHQGDPSFVGRGRQCVANSIMAIMKSKINNVDQWTEADMDTVLKDGDRIYQLITGKTKMNSDYLLLDEVPVLLEGNIIQKSMPKAGLVNQSKTEGPFHHLEGAFISLLTEMPNMDGMLLTMGNSTPSYTGAVIRDKQSQILYYFDPHSRGDTGMSVSDGKATVSSHNNVPSLCLFIKHLTSSLFQDVSKVPFEIIAVKTEKISDYQETVDNNSSFCESDSGGSNLISENQKEKDLQESSINNFHFESSESEFSGFEPVDDNELEERLSMLKDTYNTYSGSEGICSDTDQRQTDGGESEDFKVIAETVGENMNDSFTLLRTIDTDIIENYEDSPEDLPSDDSYKDPSYKLPNQNRDESSTDEDFPLNYFNRRKYFHKSKYRDNKLNQVPQDPPIENERNTSESTADQTILSNMHSRADQVEENNDKQNNNTESDAQDHEMQNSIVRKGRKRMRNESEWKRNVAKRRRNQGKSYTAKSGKFVKARLMKKACGSKCKYSCNNKLNEEAREKVFHHFWATGDIVKQRQFLIKFAQRRTKSRGRANLNSRKYSVTYTLPDLLTGESHRVCKTFFLNTIGISHQMVSTAHYKQEHLPGVVNNDGRGTKPRSRSNKIAEEQLAQVREHINSFQTIESHYCRKDSNRKYLDSELTLKKMYEMYCEKCSREETKPVLLHKYREVFNTEFNLGFYQPKKDQCDFCTRYKNATDLERESLSRDYETHIRNKELSRENKAKDKERSKTEKDLVVACFDLQQVLLTPKGFESSLYYKRRLNTFNFSLYNYETADGFCYVWNESISGRGANEMASCVYDFIEKFSKDGKKKFIFYSDNASSQNKNKFYISMLWYAMNKFNLTSVEHKYLIAGHTQNENDSVHSTIENVSRKKEIYSTVQWAAVIRAARSKKGYKVKEMCVTDFFDFKVVAENLKNFELDDNKERVYLSDIKMLKITEEEPNKVQFKTEYDQTAFRKINLLSRLSLKSSGQQVHAKNINLVNIRNNMIPISRQKYEDLVNLCASGIIPRPHHLFYLLLPHD